MLLWKVMGISFSKKINHKLNLFSQREKGMMKWKVAMVMMKQFLQPKILNKDKRGMKENV